jgi:hypothetical protein
VAALEDTLWAPIATLAASYGSSGGSGSSGGVEAEEGALMSMRRELQSLEESGQDLWAGVFELKGQLQVESINSTVY